MALAHWDGFSWLARWGANAANIYVVASGATGVAGAGYGGYDAMEIKGLARLERTWDPARIPTQIIRFRVDSLPLTSQPLGLLSFMEGSSVVHLYACVRPGAVDDDPVLEIRRGPTTALPGASWSLTIGQWYTLQVRPTAPHDTTGNVKVRLDATDVLDFTGDTRNGGAVGEINRVACGTHANIGTTNRGYRSHWLVLDDTGASFTGLLPVATVPIVRCHLPVADGFYTDGVPSGATADPVNHYVNVADPAGEIANSDVNQLQAADARDSYIAAPMTGTQLYAVSAWILAQVSTAGQTHVMRAFMRDANGSEVESADENVTLTGAGRQAACAFSNLAPDGSAWSAAGALALEVGGRRMASAATGHLNLTTAYMDYVSDEVLTPYQRRRLLPWAA